MGIRRSIFRNSTANALLVAENNKLHVLIHVIIKLHLPDTYKRVFNEDILAYILLDHWYNRIQLLISVVYVKQVQFSKSVGSILKNQSQNYETVFCKMIHYAIILHIWSPSISFKIQQFSQTIPVYSSLMVYNDNSVQKVKQLWECLLHRYLTNVLQWFTKHVLDTKHNYSYFLICVKHVLFQ